MPNLDVIYPASATNIDRYSFTIDEDDDEEDEED